MSNRDASNKARGFSYQRQYCIYLFFNSINTNITEIIEEGILDGSSYEDITIKNNNNEYITYQIKHHFGKMRFNRSNADLFKTIKNEDNLQTKVKNIYFIVSKNNNTFDDFLSNWKNKKLSGEEIYNSIINLKKDNNKKVKEYKECVIFLQNNHTDMISYINKIIIEEGFTYSELIEEINSIIKTIFGINNDIVIFYIKYFVFELFDKNWFNGNIPLNINEIYSTIKFKITNIPNNFKGTELFENIFISIIDKIKKFIELNNVSITINNLYLELNNFVEQLYNFFEIKHYLCFIHLLHLINKKQHNVCIIKLYDKIIKYLSRVLIKCINTIDTFKITDEKLEKIIHSLYYYCNHDINKSIKLKNSIFKLYFLNDEELLYIHNNIK